MVEIGSSLKGEFVVIIDSFGLSLSIVFRKRVLQEIIPKKGGRQNLPKKKQIDTTMVQNERILL